MPPFLTRRNLYDLVLIAIVLFAFAVLPRFFPKEGWLRMAPLALGLAGIVAMIYAHQAFFKKPPKSSMVKALEKWVIPILREKGFQGKFPHYRRPTRKGMDLLGFQFDKWGGGFVVEVAHCPKEGVKIGRKLIPAAKATYGDLHLKDRHRLGTKGHLGSGKGDHWFRYDQGLIVPFDKAAKEVLALLDSDAEKWWIRYAG